MKQKSYTRGAVIAALDIGSSKIACFIARLVDDRGGFEVIGAGHQASAGVRGGSIVDLAQAEAAIRQAVHAAENMAAGAMGGFNLRDVIVNVPGNHARSHRFDVGIEIKGHEIKDNDIRRAVTRAQEQVAAAGQDLIHSIPASYRIDGQAGVKEPRGMFGQALDVDMHLVTGDASALRNFSTCVTHSHLEVDAWCAAPYAAGLASLVDDEMDLGCTVIDMGGGVTSLAVFQGNALVHADAIAVGGHHVTNDIARGLTTSLAAAERLKTLYGGAVMAGTDENDLIDVPQIGEDRRSASNHVPRSLLTGIIQPRLEEILELMRARLQDSGVGASAGRRVVLTGGASQLPGLRDLAQHVLDKQVRLGRPIRVGGLAEAVSGPAFATTAGLLIYLTERSHEMPPDLTGPAAPGTLWERARSWLRENW